MDKPDRKHLVYDLILFMFLIAIDQITKKLAVRYLKDDEPFDIIKNVLQLYYLPGGNRGAAFGILQGQRVFFLIITFVVVAAVFYMLIKIPPVKKFGLLRILLIFTAAGGIGNMIDRLVLNYVIDFIYFSLINFPIFNVADMYVSCSVVILAILVLFRLSEDDIKELEGYIKPGKKGPAENEIKGD
ncbi:MAG: signal peptidase II [Lachnospiraceae bacterium]|nr:signal peptidase II [Lachnospiraceae bacterium]